MPKSFNYMERIKICLIGDKNVGKNSICVKYVMDDFSIYPDPTPAMHYEKDVNYQNCTFQLVIDVLNTDSEESHFNRVCSESDVFMFVYEIDTRNSFLHLQNVMRFVENLRNAEGINCVICGNQSDLTEQRSISFKEGQDLGDSFHSLFFETSAMYGTNIDTAFCSLIEIYQNTKKSNPILPEIPNEVIVNIPEMGEEGPDFIEEVNEVIEDVSESLIVKKIIVFGITFACDEIFSLVSNVNIEKSTEFAGKPILLQFFGSNIDEFDSNGNILDADAFVFLYKIKDIDRYKKLCTVIETINTSSKKPFRALIIGLLGKNRKIARLRGYELAVQNDCCFVETNDDKFAFSSVLGLFYDVLFKDACPSSPYKYHEHSFSKYLDFEKDNLKEIIGKGSFGNIYKTNVPHFGDCAIKSIPEECSLKEIKNSGKILSQICNPYLIKYHGISYDNLLLMDYQSGKTLFDFIHSISCEEYEKIFPLSIQFKICFELAQAVMSLHNECIEIGEIKSHNIFLTNQGYPVLTDIGISKCKKDLKDDEKNTIKNNKWKAPECFRNMSSVSSDIYSLGLVFWEIATGKILYDGMTMLEIVKSKWNNETPEIPDNCNPSFVSIIKKCLDPDPKKRINSRSLVQELEKIIEEYTILQTKIQYKYKIYEKTMPDPFVSDPVLAIKNKDYPSIVFFLSNSLNCNEYENINSLFLMLETRF